MTQTYGVALIPWSPLAGGMLTGKYSKEWRATGAARYNEAKPLWSQRLTDAAFIAIEALKPIAEMKACPSLTIITRVVRAATWCDQSYCRTPHYGAT